MTWVKVDDRMSFHHKILEAGNAAVGAWIRICAWCALQLTDGLVPGPVAEMIGSEDELSSLVRVGLLEMESGSYRVHDYLEYNLTREEILTHRSVVSERRSEAGRRGAERRWENGKTDGKIMAKRMAKPESNQSDNGKCIATVNGKRMAPSRPVNTKSARERCDQDRYEPGSGTVPVAPIHTHVRTPISDSKHRERAERDVSSLAEWSKGTAPSPVATEQVRRRQDGKIADSESAKARLRDGEMERGRKD